MCGGHIRRSRFVYVYYTFVRALVNSIAISINIMTCAQNLVPLSYINHQLLIRQKCTPRDTREDESADENVQNRHWHETPQRALHFADPFSERHSHCSNFLQWLANWCVRAAASPHAADVFLLRLITKKVNSSQRNAVTMRHKSSQMYIYTEEILYFFSQSARRKPLN